MKQSLTKKNLGNLGESIAAEYLKKHGYTIIECNYKARYGEIDIIAHTCSTLVFIEVKTRIGNTYGLPEEAITKKKIREVMLTAQYYYLLHPQLPKSHRIDVIAIELNPDKTIKDLRHIENITL